ncbi:hypothetical protein [Lactiplantibacillus plantarum]|uniref:hypothetical protein n=1 Tax=Lactiplantibacillus plantarum TaxID=1590 RepID=UPI003896E604
MEQWYRDARSYLKQYRFYHSVVSQRVAYELLGLSKSQYYVIRKQAMREWLQLINQHK